MFDAGRSSFAAFSSNTMRPLSSETTLTPTIAEASSGFATISEIRVCNSARVVGAVAAGLAAEVDGTAGAAGAGVCATTPNGSNSNKTKTRETIRRDLFIVCSSTHQSTDLHGE